MTIFDIFRPRRSCSRQTSQSEITEYQKSIDEANSTVGIARNEVRAAMAHVRSFNPLVNALLLASVRADHTRKGYVTLRAEDWQAVSDALGKIGGAA
jgi:cob(I)alamin adenosyltransferase